MAPIFGFAAFMANATHAQKSYKKHPFTPACLRNELLDPKKKAPSEKFSWIAVARKKFKNVESGISQEDLSTVDFCTWELPLPLKIAKTAWFALKFTE